MFMGSFKPWLSAFLVVALSHFSPRPSFADSEGKDPVRFSLNGESFYAPHECKAKIDEIRDLFHRYDRAGYSNRNREAKRQHQAIQKALKSLIPGETCFSWVHGAAVLYSLNLYNRVSNDRAEALIVFALPLYRSQKFIPLTRELREGWGGEWAKPNRVLGAYDCESTTIYFDPEQSPYDLGAVIAHELDHLTRDKYGPWFAGEISETEVPSILLLDELLASLHAGYLQLSFQRDMIRRSPSQGQPPVLGLDAGIYFKKRRTFRLSDDLALFHKNGHLHRLWANQVKNDGLTLGLLFSDFFESVIYPDFLANFHGRGGRHWAGIFDVVKRAYFGDSGPSHEASGQLLKAWHDAAPEKIVPSGSMLKEMADRTQRGEKAAWKDFWSNYGTLIHKATPGCRSIRAAILGGKSAGYIGSKLGGSQAGGEGNRPGMGGEGNRPATGRPGTQPSAPVTPCLFPGEGF